MARESTLLQVAVTTPTRCSTVDFTVDYRTQETTATSREIQIVARTYWCGTSEERNDYRMFRVTREKDWCGGERRDTNSGADILVRHFQ